jgi:short-subunit dehydrogenase
VRWEGATVVITGASRGIGCAVAAAAAGRGARLGLIARSAGALEQQRQQLGGHTAVVVADLADRHAVEPAWTALRRDLGPIDILVNNAGVGSWGPLVEVDDDEVERVLAVNLVAAMQLSRLALPDMLGRRRGHIVNVGSVAGRLGAPFESVYSASKFGLAGFTEALAVEVGPFGVGVSMVNPGPVATDFAATRGGRGYARRRPKPVSPERVAEAVITAVERGDLERSVPRWLRLAQAVRTVAPAMYTAGVRRAVAPQLDEFRRRWADRP